MREIKMQNGNILHVPEERQREQTIASGFYYCACHERMGNDFYFLPMASCLRPDRVCTHTNGQSIP